MFTVMALAVMGWLIVAREIAAYVPILCAIGFGSALAIDQCSRQLVADVKLAMKRADLSLDFVCRCTGVPLSRLSDQLNGKTPFTAFWRFGCAEMRETDFWLEFTDLQAQRVDRMLVSRDLGALVERVEAMVGMKPMVKMDLATQKVKAS